MAFSSDIFSCEIKSCHFEGGTTEKSLLFLVMRFLLLRRRNDSLTQGLL